MMIISYGTKNKHSASVKRLRKSCDNLNVPNIIILKDDSLFKDERSKYLYKPTFILEMLEALNEPVIWMDADSYLIARPKISHYPYDFGYVKSPPNSHKWFADSCHIHTPSNIPFLKKWKELCLEEKGHSDHTQLIRAFDALENYFTPLDVSKYMKGCYIRNYKGKDEIHF